MPKSGSFKSLVASLQSPKDTSFKSAVSQSWIGGKKVLKFDGLAIVKELGVHQSAPFVETRGCPSEKSEAATMSGLNGSRSMPDCLPWTGDKPGQLDIQITGLEGVLDKAIYSWAGIHNRAPVFQLVSAGRRTKQQTRLLWDARFLWTPDAGTTWLLTRQVGEEGLGQTLGRWNGTHAIPWPGQKTSELEARFWKVRKDVLTGDRYVEPFELVRHPFKVESITPSAHPVQVSGATEKELNGMYFRVATGENGSAFYRQLQQDGTPGFALFKGMQATSNQPAWIIAGKAFSSDGLKAFVTGAKHSVFRTVRGWFEWSDQQWRPSSLTIRQIEPEVEH